METDGPRRACLAKRTGLGLALRRCLACFVVAGLAAFHEAAPLRAQETPPDAAHVKKRVVIPFDFESQFDEGRYGRMVGDSLWQKLNREGMFILPESMLDVREWCERNKTFPNPDTPLERMQQIVRDEFDADVAIWGKVERAPGAQFDVYDLLILVVDFSGATPRVIERTAVRTKTISEIPHVHLRTALDKLSGRPSGAPPAADLAVEERWRTGRNLVQGDFEKGREAPAGWDPLPPHVRRVAAPTEGDANHVIRFQFDEDVAGTTGVLYYSDYFPVEEGAVYRFQCRWRSTGSAAKVFIKCYDELPTRFSRGAEQSRVAASAAERREVYRSQQNLKGPAMTWNVHVEDFTPRHTQFSPRWGRVMLYAYWPAGAVDWDDVVVKQIRPAPAD